MLTFNELRKNLKKDFSALKPVKFAILSDSASQFINTALRGIGYQLNIRFDVYEADYNQIDLQIFDGNSGLYEFQPDFVFINRSTEKLLTAFSKKDKEARIVTSDTIASVTTQYYETLTARLNAKVIINTYPEINDSVFGNFAGKTPYSFIYQQRRTNLLLMEISQKLKNLYICDLAALQADLGYRTVFDPKMYINADMVYSLDFIPHLAKSLADVVMSVTGTFKKCLILDLDNTMWGGIIGDDGVEGIQLGHLGSGKIYTELQLWAKQLKERGIILAVCSKNTDEIAREPFVSHPDMILRLDDIALFVANWESKIDNIKYIQSVLNIGFDSMVFVDDNPFERGMVRDAIPEVTVPELPEDPAEYLTFLRTLNLFETASFTGEDEHRTRQYQEESNRVILRQSFENESDFLTNLGMVADVKPFDAFSIPRVAQLSQRSNQFNLRTVRYTEEDIKRISGDSSFLTLSISLSDRFGDHGLIGIVILKKMDDSKLFVDSWIMSCRVLKRGVENFTLNTIAALAQSHGFQQIVGEYIPTRKNGIVKDHYLKLGFESADAHWQLYTTNYLPRDTCISLKQPVKI